MNPKHTEEELCSCGCGGAHHHSSDCEGEHLNEHLSADAFVKGALILSVHCTVPQKSDEQKVVENVKSVLEKIAIKLALDGILFGHIKALIQGKNGYVAFSMTQVGKITKKESGNLQTKDTLTVTLNIHTVSYANKITEDEVLSLLGYKKNDT